MSRNIKIYIVYLISFSLILLPILWWAWNFWDRTFPYFSADIPNIFSMWSSTWESYNLWQPMWYVSDIFFRFIISLGGFLQPELRQYILYIILCSAAAYAWFLVSSTQHKSILINILIGLVCVLNPIIVYKIFAGHLNYLASYTIFLYFIYFLFSKYKNALYDVVIASIFIALGGMQIQFFVFSFLFYILYIVTSKYSIRAKHILVLAVPLIINLPRLTNFLTWAYPFTDLIELVKPSNRNRTIDLSRIWKILSFQIATETYIWYIFSSYIFPLFASLWAFAVWWYIIHKQYNRIPLVLIIYAIIMAYLATGHFHHLHIPLVSTFSPMFREVGHFGGPLIVVILLLGWYLYSHRLSAILFCISLYSIAFVSSYTIVNYIPSIDFSYIREQFDYIHQFGQKTENQGTYRILYYPFFWQYTFRSLPTKQEWYTYLSNAGRDSFIKFWDQEYIENSINPIKFTWSLQYALATYRTSPTILENYNIQYIYDLSDTYKSLYNKYVPQETYEWNESIFEVNTSFISRLAENYPSILSQVWVDIYKVSHPLPRIFGGALKFYKHKPYSYFIWIDDFQSFTWLYFLESYNTFRQLRAIPYASLGCTNTIQRTGDIKECVWIQWVIPSLWSSMKGISIPWHTAYDSRAQQWSIDTGTKLSISKNLPLLQKNDENGILLMLYYKPQLYYIVAVYLSWLCLLFCGLYLCVRHGKKTI